MEKLTIEEIQNKLKYSKEMEQRFIDVEKSKVKSTRDIYGHLSIVIKEMLDLIDKGYTPLPDDINTAVAVLNGLCRIVMQLPEAELEPLYKVAEAKGKAAYKANLEDRRKAHVEALIQQEEEALAEQAKIEADKRKQERKQHLLSLIK